MDTDKFLTCIDSMINILSKVPPRPVRKTVEKMMEDLIMIQTITERKDTKTLLYYLVSGCSINHKKLKKVPLEYQLMSKNKLS